ncbi:MAG: type II toxin-antitoxin system RelE/ParE family toxin [Bacteroidia bacterium]|nr:type II toxin-antitoxin system RelE/ParE family toxin [Bacteroidia bacterium]
MKILWTDTAKDDLRNIYQLIKSSSHSTELARKTIYKIRKKIRLLQSNPEIGAIQEDLSNQTYTYRYLVSGSYHIIYRVAQEVQIVFINIIFDTQKNSSYSAT